MGSRGADLQLTFFVDFEKCSWIQDAGAPALDNHIDTEDCPHLSAGSHSCCINCFWLASVIGQTRESS